MREAGNGEEDRCRFVQHRPSYPTLEVSFDRKSGQYQARSHSEKADKQKVASGKVEMPVDLCNGMALILLQNLPGGAGATDRRDWLRGCSVGQAGSVPPLQLPIKSHYVNFGA